MAIKNQNVGARCGLRIADSLEVPTSGSLVLVDGRFAMAGAIKRAAVSTIWNSSNPCIDFQTIWMLSDFQHERSRSLDFLLIASLH